jgi:hypothetical protein
MDVCLMRINIVLDDELVADWGASIVERRHRPRIVRHPRETMAR